MCVVCGLPSTHSNITQALGWATLFSFTLTTFLGAWWVVTTMDIKQRFTSFRGKQGHTKPVVENHEGDS